jgi:glycine oxidase
MQDADAAIAGAGIIGLTAALELASSGLRVVVFERGRAMRESSWAAAGMLAAADPENPPELRTLGKLSLDLYPGFLARIQQLSGEKVPLRTTRTLQGSHALPPGISPLSREALYALAPSLQSGSLKFFLLEEHSLDPRDLARALTSAVRAAGVDLREQAAVIGVAPRRDSVLIKTGAGSFTATHFINACGAWASSLGALPVFPRKGQMLLVESPDPLDVVLRTPSVYLVPRGNGQIVIGATVEDAGFDTRIDSASIAALHNAAATLWPPIRGARVLDTWAGLRPATPDSLPIIGPAAEIDAESASQVDARPNSWLALGHFRNGILLAPGTAHLLRQMILNQPASVDPAAFHIDRLHQAFVHG